MPFVAAWGMALRLIRRHREDCPHTSTRYRRCRCPIHVYGTLGGEKVRRALDQTSWEAATELINGWTESGEIGVVKARVPTIAEAVARFIADAEGRKVGWEAMRKYRHLFEDRLLPWCERKGCRILRQLTVDALRQFRESWSDSPLYATKNIERLRGFCRFCQQAGWIKQNPPLPVKPPKVVPNPTLPFSRGEMQRILEACDWSRYLTRVFALAGIEAGHSHRFRDTCAVELLLAGASVEDVAMILGNTPQVVTRHYAPWVRERQERLEKLVRQSWQDACG